MLNLLNKKKTEKRLFCSNSFKVNIIEVQCSNSAGRTKFSFIDQSLIYTSGGKIHKQSTFFFTRIVISILSKLFHAEFKNDFFSVRLRVFFTLFCSISDIMVLYVNYSSISVSDLFSVEELASSQFILFLPNKHNRDHL